MIARTLILPLLSTWSILGVASQICRQFFRRPFRVYEPPRGPRTCTRLHFVIFKPPSTSSSDMRELECYVNSPEFACATLRTLYARQVDGCHRIYLANSDHCGAINLAWLSVICPWPSRFCGEQPAVVTCMSGGAVSMLCSGPWTTRYGNVWAHNCAARRSGLARHAHTSYHDSFLWLGRSVRGIRPVDACVLRRPSLLLPTRAWSTNRRPWPPLRLSPL